MSEKITMDILPEHKGTMKEKEDVIKSSDFEKHPNDKKGLMSHFTVTQLKPKINKIKVIRKNKQEEVNESRETTDN